MCVCVGGGAAPCRDEGRFLVTRRCSQALGWGRLWGAISEISRGWGFQRRAWSSPWSWEGPRVSQDSEEPLGGAGR